MLESAVIKCGPQHEPAAVKGVPKMQAVKESKVAALKRKIG
jgi:hypothetical protein